jgi:hypothetical protein
MARIPVNDAILHRAQELQQDRRCMSELATHHRVKLNRIVKGEINTVGSEWWRELHWAVNRRRINKADRLAKLSPNEGERRAARAALERLRASPPGLEEYDRQQAQRFAAEISKYQGLFDDCFKD